MFSQKASHPELVLSRRLQIGGHRVATGTSHTHTYERCLSNSNPNPNPAVIPATHCKEEDDDCDASLLPEVVTPGKATHEGHLQGATAPRTILKL